MFKFIVVGIYCLISFLISFLITGCTLWDSKQESGELRHRINEAYDFEVTHCDSFAMARGTGIGEFALRDAKNQAMKYGEELGGTHIVWLHQDECEEKDEGYDIRVVAVIYKCKL
ncbi:hypothetical protein [Shewanella atlantica]|uniref:DUF4156 domain-containing protein n=1 Tax=Shewanella atlantica TaxID=271099 RepID=A0A431VYG1_9GAMM|nr:hypothetical protein [Shewanella atlantica]RTR28270.1 hypothetical protein EKG39_19265 [Shewanella atlantica]